MRSSFRLINNNINHIFNKPEDKQKKILNKIVNKRLEVKDSDKNSDNSIYFQNNLHNVSQQHTIANSQKILFTVDCFKQHLSQNKQQDTITSFIEKLPPTDFLDFVFYMCYQKNDQPAEITNLLYDSLDSNNTISIENIYSATQSIQKRLSELSINKINSVRAKQENIQNTFINLLKQIGGVAKNMLNLLDTNNILDTQAQIDELMNQIIKYRSLKKDNDITPHTDLEISHASLVKWGLAGDLEDFEASSLEINDDPITDIFDVSGIRLIASAIEAFNDTNTSFVPKQTIKLYKKYLQCLTLKHKQLGGMIYSCEEKLIQDICSDRNSIVNTFNWLNPVKASRHETNDITKEIKQIIATSDNGIFQFNNIVQIKTVCKTLLDSGDFKTLGRVIDWIDTPEKPHYAIIIQPF